MAVVPGCFGLSIRPDRRHAGRRSDFLPRDEGSHAPPPLRKARSNRPAEAVLGVLRWKMFFIPLFGQLWPKMASSAMGWFHCP